MPSDAISQSLPAIGIDSLRPLLLATRHMAAAGHYGAAHAAFAVLESGGNAVDAGVAAGIALGVLQSDLVNVAGVAPIMIYRAGERDVLTSGGLATGPRAATADFFAKRHGGQDPGGHSAHRDSGRTRRVDHRAGKLGNDELRRLRQIGRASCRERM